MSVKKPYYRIIRYGHAGHDDYILDERYAEDRFVLCQAYKLIEDDLKKIFEFIEPANRNRNVYSHRLYELFLRCATEFESNCKRILFANGYRKSDNLGIKDYQKINAATRLSSYQLRLNIWHPNPKTFRPFKDWTKGHTLGWYKDYNNVKHDRYANFEKASLVNVINAVSAVFSILFAQFNSYSLNPYTDQLVFHSTDDNFLYTENSLFSIRPFANWKKSERYSFDWNKIKDLPDSFQRYRF